MNDSHKSKKDLVHELEHLRHKAKAAELVQYLYQRTLSNSIFIIDSTGNFIFNCSHDQLVLGYNAEEIKQMGNIQDLFGGEFWRTLARAENKTLHKSAFIVTDKTGTPHDLRISVKPVDNTQNNFLVEFFDSTEQKLSAYKSGQNKAFFQKILESVPAGIILQAPSGEIILANKLVTDIFKMPLADIQGRTSEDPAWKMIDEQGKPVPGAEHPSMLTLKTGKPIRNAIRGIFNENPDRLRWLLVNTEPLFDESGKNISSVLISFVDITEQKRLEQTLEHRILMLTQPLDNHSDIQFQDLFDLKEIQKLQDLIAQTMGVGSIITAPDGSPLTRSSNFCHLCQNIIRKTSKGLQNCFLSDAAIGRHHPDGPIIQHCLSGGLWDAGVSITVGGKHIANWLVGQVRNESQNEAEILAYAREIGADVVEFKKAFQDVPIMSTEQFTQISQTVFLIAKLLSTTAYQNIQQARFIAEQNRTTNALRESEQRFRKVYENSQVGLAQMGLDFRIQTANTAYQQMLGYSESELIGKHLKDITNPNTIKINLVKQQQLAKGEIENFEMEKQFIHKSGKAVYGILNATLIRDENNNPAYFIGSVIDITQRKKAEAERLKIEQQILQTQKLESLGVLAGGIAHDFNNILAVIMGHADLAHDELPPMAPARNSLKEIEAASLRAADLCRQMLAYSGKGKFIIEAIDLRTLIDEMLQLLKTSMSKKIILNLDLESDLPKIKGDASQIRQIIMNLVVNASEAIGDRSGVISISAGQKECSADYLKNTYLNTDLPAGRYTFLEITDTGCGMVPATLEKIFEPFFTTKFTGRGLGMSAVLGIVRAHNGALTVASKLNKGTTFLILFPVYEVETKPLPVDALSSGTKWRGKGCVLLADDEEMIRVMAKRLLEHLGFEVITAVDGLDALKIYQEQKDKIDLIILDLTMPKMNGAETFAELRRTDPKVRIAISSGYAELEVNTHFPEQRPCAFIPKPYTLNVLRQRLQGLFDPDQKC